MIWHFPVSSFSSYKFTLQTVLFDYLTGQPCACLISVICFLFAIVIFESHIPPFLLSITVKRQP